ncbi:NAD(P)/FAD-dependent oxidoreductase [Mycobacterium sp. AZCC_0083]|uniref:NAD(P)/FAD-dependent oxidoreductase n=1 Tax=Mycobacterium sp. AZCC_0083 TaxID=2735882 RepID=UPI00160F404C|nr:NAD(P)/FAD-dependent oxidoreductase [Mycobacterium sp. AZCC_0083]MBB5161720.1 thioredoxin reductase [Mycobacterium sp. AZCC_0083]
MYDAIIVGGGPAGLNAALVLGRAQRRTLLCDLAQPRNQQVRAANGFLSRDGIAPAELRRIADYQLAPYPAIERRRVGVNRIDNHPNEFRATLTDGSTVATRRVILASGVIDELPAIDGLAERWGISAFNCAYCDGWEVRDQPLAVLGANEPNIRLALVLTRFTADVQLCTNGAAEPVAEQAELLRRRGVNVHTEPVVRLEGPGTDLQQLVFADGNTLQRRYVFCHAPTRQASSIPDDLGLERLDDGSIQVDDLGQTSVPGVFAAGDLARRPTMPVSGAQIAIAAGEGAIAAIALDHSLFLEELAGPQIRPINHQTRE